MITTPTHSESDPETSRQAPSDEHRSDLQRLILSYFKAYPTEGYTDDEIVQVMAGYGYRTVSTIVKRCSELRHASEIVDSGRRRKTRSGSSAAVWVLAPERDEVEL